VKSTQLAEQDWDLVGCIGQVTVGTSGRCVVLNGCILNLELSGGVSGTADIHGLCTEDVNLKEVAGCQLRKSVLILSPLHFARFCQSSFFINLGDCYCKIFDTTYSN